MDNSQIAEILYEMAVYYEMDGVAFKPRAYEKAAAAIESWDKPVADIFAQTGEAGFFQIPGVGRGIAKHLTEILKTGRLRAYEALRKKYPVDLKVLRKLPGIGPKTIRALYEKLRVKNLDDLRRAAESNKISKLPGFGKVSEEKILASLNFAQTHAGRFLLGEVYPLASDLAQEMKDSHLFQRLEIGGSYRRMQETVGDIDILVTSKRAAPAMGFFVGLPKVAKVLQKGKTKSEIRLQNGVQVDLRIVERESWGAALQYFTGDKAHNVKLRKIAIGKGLKLSEYGLFRRGKVVAGKTEEEVYQKLGLQWIPPELRTDSGEIEAAQQAQGKPGGLPKLLNYGDVKGDLQVQTAWTDGQNSIAEMAEAARKLGREYICITDHTKSLYMAGGLDEQKLLRQMKEIDKINSKFKSQKSRFRVLKGAEVNILKDGSLDIADAVLAKLDVVGVSVHSHFQMSQQDMTKRIVRAISNPNVDILFHPTTRILGRRAPIDFDFAAVLRASAQNRVALEINAHPERLDLHDTLIRQTVASGVKLVIDSDAHNTKGLDVLHFGEGQARRGWATRNDILNTRGAAGLLEYFQK